jgi:hypothetical protein
MALDWTNIWIVGTADQRSYGRDFISEFHVVEGIQGERTCSVQTRESDNIITIKTSLSSLIKE